MDSYQRYIIINIDETNGVVEMFRHGTWGHDYKISDKDIKKIVSIVKECATPGNEYVDPEDEEDDENGYK